MVATNRIDFQSVKLRAHPGLELVSFDRLSAVEQRAMSAYEGDPELYGVLRDRGGKQHKNQVVSCDTAFLLLSLASPAALPAFASRKLGDDAGATVTRLVLDGLLEVEAGGAFVSGPAASAILFPPANDVSADDSALRRLSIAALRYGHDLELEDPAVLARKLYGYNQEPMTPELRADYDSEDAIARFLGISTASMETRWIPTMPKGKSSWRAFSAKRRGAPVDPATRVTYKLYVSPRFRALPEAFPVITRLFGELGVQHFKVGRDLQGVLRPDKIVAYFRSFEELAAAADRLRDELRACPALGVPFSCPIDESGLLSWGMDPPSRGKGFAGGESWRFWVTRRLAVALIQGKASPEPWKFAIERLSLDGFDTTTWVPSPRLWRSR